MNTAVVLLVVVLVLLTGIPLGMMQASGCPQCHLSDGVMGSGAGAAILVVFLLLVTTLERRVAPAGDAKRSAPVLLALERPPQS
jgi:hypothetical protein